MVGADQNNRRLLKEYRLIPSGIVSADPEHVPCSGLLTILIFTNAQVIQSHLLPVFHNTTTTSV